MSAVPVPEPTRAKRAHVPYDGELPSPVRPAGCEPPALRCADVGAAHLVAEGA